MTRRYLILLLTFGLFTTTARGEDPKVDADFAIQGEYTGTVDGENGKKKLGVQVIALGGGKFRAVGYSGGLPGDGWDGKSKEQVEAATADGAVKFSGEHADGTIKDGVMKVVDKDGKHIGDLKRVVRKSSTLGAKPPKGAAVLFDGSSADNFTSARNASQPARMTEDGLLVQGANSKQRFGDHTLHFEFRTPYKPAARGQGRGNSGCYLQGRYEVQVLDSFGLAGKHNECGGVYSIKDPDVNMCFPPLSWQTYDVVFTAAKFDGGKKTADARMTVRHNGVVIHDNIKLPKRTTASPLAEGPDPGFLHLQDHGNPVRFRNIWAVEKK
ncbi:MAG: DUF1080 domain-containing protein [Pirellulales bacterium]|jgi:hypothetical protein